MRFRCLLLLLGTLMPVAVMAQPLPLPDVLAQAQDGPAIQALTAESELARERAQSNRNDAGWSLFGSASVGRFRELDAGVGQVNYTGYGASVGLSHPLLGTLNDRLDAVHRDLRSAELLDAQASLARYQQRLAVRIAYADWWQARQQTTLCERHRRLARLEREVIDTRYQARQLRTSDHLWLTRGWEQQLRPCTGADGTERLARQRLSDRAGVAIGAHHSAMQEELPPPDAGQDLQKAVLAAHPVLSQRREHWHQAQADETDWYDPIDARISISQQLDRRSDIPGTGTGLVAALSFEVPLGGLGERRDRQRLQERSQKYRWLDARAEVSEQINETLNRYRNAHRQWLDVRDETELARQRVWEQQQRLSVDNNGFLALRTAVLSLAQAEAAELEAYGNAWRLAAEMALLGELARSAGPTEPDPAATRAHATAMDWSRGVYVWDSADLLSPQTRADTIAALRSAGFDTIYLGLSADQLRQDNLNRQLSELLEAMDQAGLSTHLLLGEPTWINPEPRNELVALIRDLSGVPFDGLHLDLEVEQLGWPVPDDRVTQWLATLRAASAVSPWPVSIVAHHRWFSDPEFREPVCIPCELPGLGIRDASLMAYTTASDRLDQIVARATALSPGLRLGVVQSMEASLPESNSWFSEPPETVAALEQRWQGQWQSFGVVLLSWQDWADYQRHQTQAAPTQ